MLQRFLSNFRGINFLYPIFPFLLLFVGMGDCFGQGVLTVTATATSACSAPNSLVIVTVSGGSGNYSYKIDAQPYQGNSFFTNISAGPHTIMVQDLGVPGLAGSVTINIGCIDNILVSSTSATCGAINGALAVTAFDDNGVAVNPAAGGPYQYSIDNGMTWQASPVFANIPGKTMPYPVWVKNAANTIGGTSAIVNAIAGANATLTATPAGCNDNDGSVVVTPISGVFPFTFKIDNGSYGSPAPSATFTGLDTGDHRVYIMDANGCEGLKTVNVPLNNTLVLKMGGDATICEGQRTTLGATSPNGVSYAWSPATGLSSPMALSPSANPTTTTTYTLTATWGVCTQTGTETVNVNAAPVANAGPSDTTCYGKSTALQGSGTGTGTLTYQWYPTNFLSNRSVAAPAVLGPTATTTYALRVTDGNGCSSLNISTATVVVTAPPQVSAGPDTNVAAGQPVPLRAFDVNNSGFVSYAWSPAAGLSSASGADVTVLAATVTTSYVVTATTAAGCIGLDSATVKVFKEAELYVPSAFSPNHDGHNDVLRLIGPSIRELKVFAVYDRWGSQVFTTSNLAVGWDGTRGGRELPPGVYVWMAVGVDFSGKVLEKRGTVVLVR